MKLHFREEVKKEKVMEKLEGGFLRELQGPLSLGEGTDKGEENIKWKQYLQQEFGDLEG